MDDDVDLDVKVEEFATRLGCPVVLTEWAGIPSGPAFVQLRPARAGEPAMLEFGGDLEGIPEERFDFLVVQELVASSLGREQYRRKLRRVLLLGFLLLLVLGIIVSFPYSVWLAVLVVAVPYYLLNFVVSKVGTRVFARRVDERIVAGLGREWLARAR